MFDALPFVGERFDQVAVELESGEKILAKVVGYDHQVKQRYLESRGPDGTYLVTQAFDRIADGYVTRDITFNDDASSVIALRKKKDRKKGPTEGKGENGQAGEPTAKGSKQPKKNEAEPKAEDADARRTKHIENRHINRNKYKKRASLRNRIKSISCMNEPSANLIRSLNRATETSGMKRSSAAKWVRMDKRKMFQWSTEPKRNG